MNLGLNIKKYRLSKGMTQEELAEYTGVSSRVVSRWENRITYPDISLLQYLQIYLKLPWMIYLM